MSVKSFTDPMRRDMYQQHQQHKEMGIRVLVALVPVLLLLLWVTSKSQCLSTHLLSNPHFIFSVFNSIVLLITVRNHKPPNEELERDYPSLQSPYDKHEDREYNDGANDKYYGSYSCDNGNSHSSNRHSKINNTDEDENRNEEDNKEDDDKKDDDEDEDENGSQNEADQLDQKEENDKELEKRIEDFIAMVNKRWREEKLRDKLLDQICSS